MLYNLNKHLKFIILWGVIFAVLIFFVSLFLPKYYSAESDLLLLPRAITGVDSYTQAKSTERTGENLSQVLATTDFYKKVMAQTVVEIDKVKWEKLSERKQRKAWARDVKASMKYGTSLMHVSTYAKSKEEAVKLSNAVVFTIIKSGWEYVGSEITIKPVNDPLVSFLPARPSIFLNTLLGLILGLLLSTLWVVKSDKKEYNN